MGNQILGFFKKTGRDLVFFETLGHGCFVGHGGCEVQSGVEDVTHGVVPRENLMSWAKIRVSPSHQLPLYPSLPRLFFKSPSQKIHKMPSPTTIFFTLRPSPAEPQRNRHDKPLTISSHKSRDQKMRVFCTVERSCNDDFNNSPIGSIGGKTASKRGQNQQEKNLRIGVSSAKVTWNKSIPHFGR